MSLHKMPAIAIDGPAGAGKSTVAKLLAQRLSIPYLDTGAMYRALTWYALKNRVSIYDVEALQSLYKDLRMEVEFDEICQRITVNGEDTTPHLREKEVSELVSPLSAHPFIREIMVLKQREIAKRAGTVLDGRDIGTVVLPDAPLKIFLTASLSERTRRRLVDFQNMGLEMSFDELSAEIAARDLRDSTRATAPLRQAEDAYLLDSTDLTVEEVVEVIIGLLKERNLLSEEMRT